jgi:hypothetical protein
VHPDVWQLRSASDSSVPPVRELLAHRALNPPPSSSLAEERTPPLHPPPRSSPLGLVLAPLAQFAFGAAAHDFRRSQLFALLADYRAVHHLEV